MVSIRAVYRDGQLRPLDPLDLREGEEVQIQIVKPLVPLADAVADMLVTYDDASEALDEDAVQNQLDAVLESKRPLSEIIITDRHADA
ncbi:MAG: antitoxin family protein [Chloroflexota bacterium]